MLTRYLLTQSDIEQAIREFVRREHGSAKTEFDVIFHVTEPDGPRGTREISAEVREHVGN